MCHQAASLRDEKKIGSIAFRNPLYIKKSCTRPESMELICLQACFILTQTFLRRPNMLMNSAESQGHQNSIRGPQGVTGPIQSDVSPIPFNNIEALVDRMNGISQ